jgi:hypothetical protein
MDRLRTTTRSYQSQNQTDNGKDPYRHSVRPTNASFEAGRETHDPTPTNPNRILLTLLRVQRSGIKTIPTATRVGPRHRTKTRPPRKHARKGVCPNSARIGSTRNIPPRAPRQRIHHRVQEPIRSAILLHQKERRETPTGARLPKAQRMDPSKRHTTPTHPRTHCKSPRSQPVYQVRHSLGIQQYTNMRQRPMEGGIHHEPRPLRTTSHVLRNDQLPSHLPDHDECVVQRRTLTRLAVNLYG